MIFSIYSLNMGKIEVSIFPEAFIYSLRWTMYLSYLIENLDEIESSWDPNWMTKGLPLKVLTARPSYPTKSLKLLGIVTSPLLFWDLLIKCYYRSSHKCELAATALFGTVP